jgi:hypothetical protein
MIGWTTGFFRYGMFEAKQFHVQRIHKSIQKAYWVLRADEIVQRIWEKRN